jgi:hypothetical protein
MVTPRVLLVQPAAKVPRGRCRVITHPRVTRVFAWLADAMEQVFLGDLFPGIIGFGRVHCVRYSLAVTGWHGFP